MKYFNDHFDVPPTIVLNELIYRKPDKLLINMMEDATKYAMSKICSLCNNGSELIDTDSDASSVRSALYGEENFGEDDHLSYETCETFCSLLPKCMPFNSHLHARRKDSNINNCWCPCSPPIWKWLVSEIPALERWFSHCNSVDEDVNFPMTANNVHLHLRRINCTLHKLAEYYHTALMTYYQIEVKNNVNYVCCSLIEKPELKKHLSGNPSYNRQSPHVTAKSVSLQIFTTKEKSLMKIKPILKF